MTQVPHDALTGALDAKAEASISASLGTYTRPESINAFSAVLSTEGRVIGLCQEIFSPQKPKGHKKKTPHTLILGHPRPYTLDHPFEPPLLKPASEHSFVGGVGSTAVASLSRVVFQDGDASAFELSMPSASAGEVLAEMSVQPADSAVPTTASFPFTFFDDNIALNCGECRAPSSAGAAFRVTITNFLLSKGQAASDQISVSFGYLLHLSITSQTTTHTSFTLNPLPSTLDSPP